MSSIPPSKPLPRLLAASRWTALNWAVPLLLAWLATSLLHRQLLPEVARKAEATTGSFGAVRITLRLPGTYAGIAEPVLVCGVPGRATLVYLRLLENHRARVGIEFWDGAGARRDAGIRARGEPGRFEPASRMVSGGNVPFPGRLSRSGPSRGR